PTPCGELTVEGNHIHHVMQLLSDGGGIYTLGRQPGTVLRGNCIHHVPPNAGRAESNGMFLDEGTDAMQIEGNLIHDVACSPLRFHRAQRVIVNNNLLVVAQNKPPVAYNATNAATIAQSGNLIGASAADFGDAATEIRRKCGPSAEVLAAWLAESDAAEEAGNSSDAGLDEPSTEAPVVEDAEPPAP
ncbi:MAG: right-handed parallel beta-helix repeat-containing protein, partial [Planctomycetales bacterium]|nr:right-handed parallel beta-helix repeat-containing protein [Planctomycetales bacterium]